MTRKKKAQEQQEATLYVVDKVIETDKGSLVMRIDPVRAEGILRTYTTALLAARGIPRDNQAIQHQEDEVFGWYMKNQSYLFKNSDGTPRPDGVERIIAIVNSHYDRLREQVSVDATMLTMTKDTVFEEFDPEPYSDEFDDEELPGIANPPQPVRDLSFPVERRLKQIYDMAMSKPAAFLALRSSFDAAAADLRLRVQGLTEEGFRQGDSGESEDDGVSAAGKK